MITLNEIKNKMTEDYSFIDKKKFFIPKNTALDTYTPNVDFSKYAFECFTEILNINLKCSNKILEINDIIFPLKRAYYYSDNVSKYSASFIETKDYVYVNKEKAKKYINLYYELKDTNQVVSYASRLKKIAIENNKNLNAPSEDYDSNAILEMAFNAKKEFLTYINDYQNIFYKLEEYNDDYIVFRKNIDESFNFITENLLIENKEKIYEILKNTDKIENDKIENGTFNGLKYSYICTIPKYQDNKELQKKLSLNMYSEEKNELRLDCLIDGFLYICKTKIYVFIFEETNSIYYFGDLDKDSYRKMISVFFPNFKINKFEKLL